MNIFKESANPYPFGCENIFWKLLYRRYEVADINEHELCKSTDAFIDILVSNVDPNLTIYAGSDLDPSVLRYAGKIQTIAPFEIGIHSHASVLEGTTTPKVLYCEKRGEHWDISMHAFYSCFGTSVWLALALLLVTLVIAPVLTANHKETGSSKLLFRIAANISMYSIAVVGTLVRQEILKRHPCCWQ